VTAIQYLVNPSGTALAPFEIPANAILVFLAFVVTVIPFYHGATLALTKVTLLGARRLLHMSNFAMLLIEAMIFYAMAASISSVHSFMVWFAILMAIDVAWVAFVHVAGGSDKQAPRRWAYINFAMCVILVMLLSFDFDRTSRYALLSLSSLARTLFDYVLTSNYYFD
jgi:hypothetical protein